MKSNYKKLGEFIQQVSEKNKNLEITKLLGVSITKEFITSIANTVGTDMSNYKIVRRSQFAYGPVTSRNGDKISVAHLKQDDCIISTSYTVFEVIDHDKLDPEYLMMWFRRPEFDRYARYKSHGSVREMFDWEEMCEVELPVPSIEKQREIVREYNTVSNRIKLNEELNRKLEETAQAIYKHWFVDFEFPNISGLPYKSSGGKMLWNEELEKEIPVGWRVGKLGDLCEYSNSKIAIGKINISKYISTDNMLPHKRGIEIASSLPNTNKVVEFRKKDILLSNIRPYFKKIYFADFDGGCSNDVLCIRNKLNISNFLYFTIEQDIFFEYVMAGSKGTKMPRGDKNWIMKYSIIIPEKSDIIKFETFTEGILNKISSNTKQIQTLTTLRDTLLPQLISGKLKVPKSIVESQEEISALSKTEG